MQTSYVFFGIIVVVACSGATAQKILQQPDSIAVTKEKSMKPRYRFHTPIEERFSLVREEPVKIPDGPKAAKGSLAEGAFTLLTGISISGSEKALWMLKSAIKADDGVWDVLIYVAGEESRSRERVKNDDGSFSVETTEERAFHWSEAPVGLVLQDRDTVAVFSVHHGSAGNEENKKWLARLQAESQWVRDKVRKLDPYGQYENNALAGYIGQHSFTVLTSGNHFRSLVLIDNQPAAIFQYEPPFLALGKKNKVVPYMLLDPSIGDRKQIAQLCMLGRLVELLLTTGDQ